MEKQEKRHGEGYHQEKDYTLIETREVTAVNLLVIRDIFKLINNGKILLEDFYYYLFTREDVSKIDVSQRKKYKNQMDTYYKQKVGNINSVINTLKAYGISAEFFDGEKIGVSESIWASYKDYLDADFTINENKTYNTPAELALKNKNYDFSASAQIRKKVQQELIKEIYTICNLDGSLVIESIRDIIMDMTHTNITENYNSTDVTLLQQIDNYQVAQGVSYTQNNLIKLYSQMAKQVGKEEFTFDVKTSDFSRITKTTDNELVCDNLFIIIKTYQMLASIEGIQDADENLKKYLNLKKDDYEYLTNGDTVRINSKDIAEKLAIYRFPATLFRADHPTMINLSKNIMDAFDNFKTDYDITLFEFRLQFWLTYCIDTQNIVLILAVYSLFKSLNDK